VKAVFSTGEQFVNIALMAHVPDEPVFGRVENAVQGDINSTTPRFGPRCPPVFGKDGDQLLADFFGQ